MRASMSTSLTPSPSLSCELRRGMRSGEDRVRWCDGMNSWLMVAEGGVGVDGELALDEDLDAETGVERNEGSSEILLNGLLLT